MLAELGPGLLELSQLAKKYGIGLKELWQVKPEHFKPGLVQHTTAGFPHPYPLLVSAYGCR